jgi:hypothetical protein
MDAQQQVLLQDWQQKNSHIPDINIPISKVRPVYLGYDKEKNQITLCHTLTDNYQRFISLSLNRFAKLMTSKEEIDAMVRATKSNPRINYMKHIGGNIFVSITSKYHTVDIRQFGKEDSNFQATPAGVALHFAEWYFLKQSYKYVVQQLPELESMKFCGDIHNTEKDVDAFDCVECFPQ